MLIAVASALADRLFDGGLEDWIELWRHVEAKYVCFRYGSVRDSTMRMYRVALNVQEWRVLRAATISGHEADVPFRLSPSSASVASISVEWAYAPPARISAATQMASISSSGEAPARNAALL